MFKILIVDDEYDGRISLKILLESEFKLHISDVEFATSIEDAKSKISKQHIDILFLDVNLQGEISIDSIGDLPPQLKIIFVTAYSEFMLKALRLRAFDYLLKPVNPDELNDCFKRLLKEMRNTSSDKLQIRSGGISRFVEISNIMYIKGDGPYSIIHMTNEKHTVAKTIKILATELPSIFIRIHKSYLINKKYLKSFAKGKVFLFDNICLPLSRNGSKNL